MLFEWKNSKVLGHNILPAQVHFIELVPPKVSIEELMGTLEGNYKIIQKLSTTQEETLLG